MISRSVGDDAGNFWYFFEKFPGGLLTMGGDSDKIVRVEGRQAQATGVQGAWI